MANIVRTEAIRETMVEQDLGAKNEIIARTAGSDGDGIVTTGGLHGFLNGHVRKFHAATAIARIKKRGSGYLGCPSRIANGRRFFRQPRS